MREERGLLDPELRIEVQIGEMANIKRKDVDSQRTAIKTLELFTKLPPRVLNIILSEKMSKCVTFIL